MPSHVYVHSAPESLRSRLLQTGLRLMRAKNALATALEDPESRNVPATIPRKIARRYHVETEEFEGRDLWTIGPKHGRSEKVVFYVHGGAYVFNVGGLHWNFVPRLVDLTGATFVMANYPLIPNGDAKQAHGYLHTLYRQTLDRYSGKSTVVMGDSAGGGLAIAFAQAIRDAGRTQPERVIVLSPWLDVTMSNPDIEAIDPNDRALHAGHLRRAGSLFAGSMDTNDPRVSPIYGSFEDMARVSIFIGSHDLFVADTRKLKARLEADQIAFDYYEYPRMMHTWAFFPMPEASVALAQMAELVNTPPG